MDSLTLENFRCFRERQTARLAPLTLLVGENSTGKTSFLAMIRAMRELAFSHDGPDFKKEPYDLGSFDEIAHYMRRQGRPCRRVHGRGDVLPSRSSFKQAPREPAFNELYGHVPQKGAGSGTGALENRGRRSLGRIQEGRSETGDSLRLIQGELEAEHRDERRPWRRKARSFVAGSHEAVRG